MSEPRPGAWSPTISFITLGVSDVARASQFYSALGWQADARSSPIVAFYQLNGVILSLYGREALAAEWGGVPGPPSPGAVMFSHNVESDEQIEPLLTRVTEAGGALLSGPRPTPWGGRRAWFADPDGHAWEIVYNPNIRRDANGGVWFRGGPHG